MQRPSDRWVSIALSVLLHGALVAALVYGWLLFRSPPAPHPTLAIEATVVDARTVKGVPRPPPPEPTPPAAAPAPTPVPPTPEEASGPPQPTPEELAQREEQRRQAAAAAADEQRRAEEHAAQAEAQRKAEEQQRKAEEQQRKAEEQRQAQKRAEAERKARAAAEAQKRADAQQLKAQDDNARAELQRSLAAEEHADVARSSAAVANWEALIAAKITRAWIRPPSARPGLECTLNVTQVPGGVVTRVSIGQCNAEQAVRESIEAAVYRASPLPPPPAGVQFDPDLHIDFKPD
ncbi:MAG TPA: cell envelope integrity protein TolA [Steroidobacteraceae bacterium]|nr:cell envelope integrity protein TolA [Steroidobacteraceae bacterium]